MKKTLLITFIILIGCTITGCFGSKSYDEIDYNKLTKMINNKESFVLVIGREGCSACAPYKITIRKIVENEGADIKYIDISKLAESDSDGLLERFNFSGTPTTILLKKGKESDRIVGNEKYSVVVKKLKEKGYIK